MPKAYKRSEKNKNSPPRPVEYYIQKLKAELFATERASDGPMRNIVEPGPGELAK